MNPHMTAFIQGLPKVELHLHIEGSLEPDLCLNLLDAITSRFHLAHLKK